MKAIPTLFKRGHNHLVYDQRNKDMDWVGKEGIATRKYDGRCAAIINGQLYSRRAIKNAPAPEGFITVDLNQTGNQLGWEPCTGTDHQHLRDAKRNTEHWLTGRLPNGTYEACGPSFQGNPENFQKDCLIPHGKEVLFLVPTTFIELRSWLRENDMEGVVWYRDPTDPDAPRAKIKLRDFGLKRAQSRTAAQSSFPLSLR